MVERQSQLQRTWHLLRWLVRTPWPVLALDMLRANVAGALFTFAFLRFGLPAQTSVSLSEISGVGQTIFVLYLVIAGIVSGYATIRLSLPVLVWHRRRSRLDNESARRRALRLPLLLMIVHGALWLVGGAVFSLLSLSQSGRTALVVALGSFVGALVTCVLGYMQSEKVLRPITVAAMANNPEDATAPSVTQRIILFWVISVAAPLAVIIALVVGQQIGVIDTDAAGLQRPILWMAGAALAFGSIGLVRLVSAIADPIKQLRLAQHEVREGNLDTSVRIYDGSDLGLLQAGFNEMVADVRERQAAPQPVRPLRG